MNKSVNESPEQPLVDEPDNRDEWKESNRHLRAVLAEAYDNAGDADEVVRAFKVAKNKKSFTEIPPEQNQSFC